jgi:hypothetical protein
MNTQPEALRLAEAIEIYGPLKHTPPISKEYKAAAELRRLQSLNAELLEALNRIASIELQMYGGDWDEITEAQAIAKAAIAKAQG